MADQYTPAPAPSKTEFNTLNTQVQGLAEQIGTLLKRVIYTSGNLTISANGYAKVCNYSDLGTGVTYNNIVSVERYSSNMTGATWFEVYSDGIYIYSTLAQTNKWVKLNVVLTSLNIPETIIN